MLSHLPPLPRLEALDLGDSKIEDDDLRRLAALPRLKSLSLRETRFFTPAGLKSLGSLDLLEEVRFGYDIVPEEIEALGAIKRLKRLHLDDIAFARVDVDDLASDDGKKPYVTYSGRFRRAVRSLRQSKPDLVIDKEDMPIFWKPDGAVGSSYLKVDSFPERPAAWLPGGDLVWMTPKELADFEQSGGRASFYGATYPGGPGQEPTTAEF
ncbi:MAG TPA: hypothetical protein PK867_22725 [Pirellulales bacterium]|nr:hypothetical protein [Pirellulales bacterium]